MTDIKQKALEMISAARKEHPTPDNYLIARTALCRAIEQHEATKQELSDYKQKVSDIVKAYTQNLVNYDEDALENLKSLIIPAPKPDPLAAAMNDIGIGVYDNIKTEYADTLRADIVRRFRTALDARGFEIREKV